MRKEKFDELNKIIEEFKTTEVFEPDIDKNEKCCSQYIYRRTY